MNNDDLDRLKSSDTTMDEKCNRDASEAAAVLTNLGISVSQVSKADEREEKFVIPQRFTRSGRKRAVSFPLKLMRVLSNKEFGHIIQWMPSGRSFAVLKPGAFAAEILPDHFKSAKFSSFTRKLHRWGFTRHYKGEESGAFYHKDFQRDRIDLAENMACVKAEEPTIVPSKSDSTPSPTEISCAVVTSTAYKSDPRRVSMPSAAASAPFVVRRASGASTMSHTAHGLIMSHLPLLGIPVPTQQLPSRLPGKQQMGLNLPETPSQSALVAAKMNAAIELEVSRLLRERIAAATSHMSQIPPGPAALNGLLSRAPVPMQRPVPITVVPSTQESLRLKLMQMQQQKEQMQYLAMTGALRLPSQGLEEMPKTNIQGAKTA